MRMQLLAVTVQKDSKDEGTVAVGHGAVSDIFFSQEGSLTVKGEFAIYCWNFGITREIGRDGRAKIFHLVGVENLATILCYAFPPGVFLSTRAT